MDNAAAVTIVHLRTHRRRQAKAHRAQTARSQPGARFFDAQMQSRPHLMLTYISCKGIGLSLGVFRHLMQRPGNRQPVHMVVIIISFLPALNLLPPFVQIPRGLLLHQQAQNNLHIASQPQAVADILINLGRVNVNVNELCILRILLDITRLTVTEAAANGDD